jgi:hypothetical protein
MFNQGGLSLEQAPPISVVLNFFITASFFGLLLGLYLLGDSTQLLPTNDYAFDLTVVHLLSLGVMASFMLGALFQMLPVLAGVVIHAPVRKSIVINALLIVGIVLQLLAFHTHNRLLYLGAAIVLGVALLYATTMMLKELIGLKDHSSSSRGMLFSLGSFALAILLGVYLLLSLGGYIDGRSFEEIKTAHYSFALFGWVSLLIISVSFQVVEMFYVTPKYPDMLSKYLILALFILLVFKLLTLLAGISTTAITILLSLLFILYGGITIHRFYRRRRPTSDATVWFWRLGMGLLIISMSIVILNRSIGIEDLMPLSYLSFIGFALSIVFAMIYKIVPFLVWFHLSNQGYIEAPMMHDVIHPKRAKVHFGLHTAMLLVWSGSMLLEFQLLIPLASLLTTLSFGWILYHLIVAWRQYNYIQQHTEKIEW